MRLPISLLVFPISLLVLAACGKDAPSGPATYTYSFSNAALNGGADLPIWVNGARVGTYRAMTIPREVRLSDPATKIEAVLETSCGTERFALTASTLRQDETKLRAESTDRVSWMIDAPPIPTEHEVYLDNKWGGKTARIEIGTRSFDVKPQAGTRTKMTFGSCASGRSVKIDGEAVGEIAVLEPRWAAIVSVPKDGCYVLAVGTYDLTELSKYEDHPVDSTKMSAFQLEGHLGKVGEVDYVFTDPPEKDEAFKQIRVLLPTPCEIARRVNAARSR